MTRIVYSNSQLTAAVILGDLSQGDERQTPGRVPISDHVWRSNFDLTACCLYLCLQCRYMKNSLHERGRFQQQNNTWIRGNTA